MKPILKLPIIKDMPIKTKVLSMDEYLKFVEDNLKESFDRESYWKWKKIASVDVPFKLI